jgi:hypothetical protein
LVGLFHLQVRFYPFETSILVKLQDVTYQKTVILLHYVSLVYRVVLIYLGIVRFSGISRRVIRRNVSPPSSGSKNKRNKELA